MKIPLFYSDLFVEKNVGSTSEREKLLNFILSVDSEIRNKSKPVLSMDDFVATYSGYNSLSEDGCFRFNINDTISDFKWLCDAINKLVDDAINNYISLDATHKIQVQKTKMRKSIALTWVNINDPESRIVLHEHKKGMFSFIYYIQSTDTGDLILRNQANVMNECNLKSPFVSAFSYPPEDGDLILFPSWIPHEIKTNKSNMQRINVSGDIILK